MRPSAVSRRATSSGKQQLKERIEPRIGKATRSTDGTENLSRGLGPDPSLRPIRMSSLQRALADSPGHLDGGDDLLPALFGAHLPDRLGLKRVEVVPVHGRETVGAGRDLGAN